MTIDLTPDGVPGFIALAVVGLLFVGAIGFNLYWSISGELIWASRVRGLLEREGFTVRHMERRWFTRGPFPDLKPPGTKFHKEWLVRLVAVDREHRPRAGWLRWHRRRRWEAADKWAVQWDDVPWLGAWDAAKTKGWSSRVFFPVVLVPAVAGAIAGITLLVLGFKEQREARATLSARQQSGGVSAPAPEVSRQGAHYELRCRGGNRDAFQIEELTAGTRREPDKEVLVVLMSLRFTASVAAAGADGAGLGPGTCSWIDRPLNEQEPRVIRFEAPGMRMTDPPHPIRAAPGSFPDKELGDPTRYWSFQAFNFGAGHFWPPSYRPSDPLGK